MHGMVIRYGVHHMGYMIRITGYRVQNTECGVDSIRYRAVEAGTYKTIQLNVSFEIQTTCSCFDINNIS